MTRARFTGAEGGWRIWIKREEDERFHICGGVWGVAWGVVLRVGFIAWDSCITEKSEGHLGAQLERT